MQDMKCVLVVEKKPATVNSILPKETYNHNL